MKLTEEALKHYWKNREQIFNAQENQAIIKRFFWLSDLFDKIKKINITNVKIDNNEPLSDYFAFPHDFKGKCLAIKGLIGVKAMAEHFSATGVNNLPQLITEIGCMLSGSEFYTDSSYFDNNTFIQGNFPNETPIIHEEFRIISNTVTNANDAGTLTSVGQMRHPTLHLANNNYFYNVIDIIKNINNFPPKNQQQTGPLQQTVPPQLVLRWSKNAVEYYKSNKEKGETETDAKRYQDSLIHRFPYKFFYMWANKDNKISIQDNGEINVVEKSEKSTTSSRILHLIGLAAYRGLVNSDIDFQNKKVYYNDQNFDQKFQDFKKEWPEFSQAICNIITPEDTILDPNKYIPNYNFKYDYINELSLLLSIVLSKPQEMVDTTELIESGNKALILWGPPGTGKTYTAKQIIRELLKLNDTDNLEDYKFKENQSLDNKTGCWSLVQFHPNYTYEDFIGGISPNLKRRNLSYTLKEGIFKKICDAARKDNQFSDIAAAANYVNKATQASYPLPYIKKAIASIKDALKKIESDKNDKKIDQNTYNDVLKDCRTIISEILNITKEILQKIQPANNTIDEEAKKTLKGWWTIISEIFSIAKDILQKIQSANNTIDEETKNTLKSWWTIISEIFSIAKDILQKIQPTDINSVEDPANSEITIESIDKIIDELNKIINPNNNEESNPDFTSLGEQITKVGEIIDKLETQEKEANNQDSPSENDTNSDDSTSKNEKCKEIHHKYSKKYILIIDEINRADLSAVFGELMYALEYRNEKITIPNFEEEFTIPDNVYIIGTMNSIDKSLVTFDLALRRRFSFYKVMPQIPVLNTILAAYQISQKSLSTFLSHCLKLNAQISGVSEDGDSNADKNALMLGEDYQIGQAYFAKIKDFLETVPSSGKEQDIRPDHMQKLWSYHLLPLLEEYLGNQVEDADIKKKLKEIEKQFVEMDDTSNN